MPHFVRATCFVSIFVGPWAHLWQSSSLGLEPILLFYLFSRVFESFCISYLFHVYFMFNRYLSCRAISFRINLRFMLIVIS